MKIPYSVMINFNENEITTYGDYVYGVHDAIYKFHTGKYLKDAINYYVYPHFDPNSSKHLILEIETSNIKGYRGKKEGEGAFSIDSSIVDVTLRTRIYYDYIILYDIHTEGSSAVKVQLVDYSMWDAAQNAIIEAVKKIPNEVAQVFLNPEKAILKTNRWIEVGVKHIEDPGLRSGLIIEYIKFANLLRLVKKYDEAIAAAKSAIALNPNVSAAYTVLGLIYQKQKKYKESEENFKKAIALDPKFQPYYLNLANLYYEKESYNEAVNTLTKAIEINPSDIEAIYLLINTYMAMGQFDKAIQNADKAIKYNTITGVGIRIKKAEVDYPVVKMVLEEGPAKMAGIEIGDKIIKVNNQSTEKLKLEDVINLLRGEEGTQVALMIKRGDKEFEKKITRKTMIDKKASLFFAQRSLCYREKGNLDQAMKDAEKAYSLNPNLDDTKEALSAVYIDKGKYDEAINILSSANKDNNFSKLLLYKDSMMQSVKTLEAKGQYKEAIKVYANLLKIADEKEAKGIRAHIAELMIKYPHLFALPEEARKFVIKAETYTEEGKFEKAIEEYQKALELSPFFPNLYKALALSYGQIKDYRKAIYNMNIYLELYPDAPDIRTVKDQIYKWEFMMEKGE
jgi:tetratricopeptide (TPR) repeat protein